MTSTRGPELEDAPRSADGGERRWAERHEVRVRVEAHGVAGQVRLEGEDVSRTGLFVASPHAPQPGFALHVTLQLPSGPLDAIGTVVRVEPGRGFGMRLSIPWDEGRTRWWHYLDSLSDTFEPVRGRLLEDHEDEPGEVFRGVIDPREIFDFHWTNEEP